MQIILYILAGLIIPYTALLWGMIRYYSKVNQKLIAAITDRSRRGISLHLAGLYIQHKHSLHFVYVTQLYTELGD